MPDIPYDALFRNSPFSAIAEQLRSSKLYSETDELSLRILQVLRHRHPRIYRMGTEKFVTFHNLIHPIIDQYFDELVSGEAVRLYYKNFIGSRKKKLSPKKT